MARQNGHTDEPTESLPIADLMAFLKPRERSLRLQGCGLTVRMKDPVDAAELLEAGVNFQRMQAAGVKLQEGTGQSDDIARDEDETDAAYEARVALIRRQQADATDKYGNDPTLSKRVEHHLNATVKAALLWPRVVDSEREITDPANQIIAGALPRSDRWAIFMVVTGGREADAMESFPDAAGGAAQDVPAGPGVQALRNAARRGDTPTRASA